MDSFGKCLCCFFSGIMIGMGVIGYFVKLDVGALRKQAIEHGAAEYDSKTGKWQWKESR